jgi:SnoaL-like domain
MSPRSDRTIGYGSARTEPTKEDSVSRPIGRRPVIVLATRTVQANVGPSPRDIAARYCEMWNTGNSSIAAEILSSGWVDHAHPEVAGPRGVWQAVEQARTAQPDLRFQVDAILGDADLGGCRRVPRTDEVSTRLVWLIGLKDGQMTEMWTYRDMTR